MGSYVPTTAAEREEMLAAIGVKSLEDLYQAVPQEMLPNGKQRLFFSCFTVSSTSCRTGFACFSTLSVRLLKIYSCPPTLSIGFTKSLQNRRKTMLFILGCI